MENLSLYLITWNVGTSPPDQDLHSLLQLAHNPKNDDDLYDFYVISLQEVKAQPQNLLMDTMFDDPWTNEFRKLLEIRNYVKVKTSRLQGLVLSVFCLRKHLLYLRDVEAQYTRTGFSGMWGNKGAVSIRLGIYGCSICIVNAHLSAHDHMLQERIDDYNSIMTGQEFHVKETSKILFHDYVFWVGDLNFRLSGEATTPSSEIIRLIKKGDLESLLAKDQLRLVMETGDAFSELNETLPKFPPTFKFEVGTSVYDEKRRPSWCDRILYKVNPYNYENTTLHMEQHSYKSHSNYFLSDHKPVSSDFTIKVFSEVPELLVKFLPIPIWYLEEENSAVINLPEDMKILPNDWIAIFKDGFSSLDDYFNYIYVNAAAVRESPTSYKINFPETVVRNSGMYRLVYFSQTPDSVQSVFGMSEPFHLQPRD